MKMPPLTCQRGMALVTSLIMLGLVTLLAIAFIGLSRRERHSVEVTKKTTEAKLMADASLARAQAEVMGRLKDNINLQMLVSTNGPATSPTIDPRVPVVYTVNGQPEERFFLNLNRDSDPSGHPLFQPTAGSWMDSNPANVPYSGRQDLIYQPSAGGGFVGDPQWIGVLEDPSQPHGPDNRFIGRYAYMVVPASKALDLNLIHNNDKRPGSNAAEGYFRGAGTASADLNLAAILAQLSGVVWPYESYYPMATDYPYVVGNVPNLSAAFSDAFGLFRYRTNNNSLKDIHDLLSLPGLFGSPPQPMQQRMQPPASIYGPFSARLKAASTSDPYAFYKLAATLTTVSFPPKATKFDLNNPSNLLPENYFREVADRLLQASIVSSTNAAGTNYHIGNTSGPIIGTSAGGFVPAAFNLANIQIYPTNQYTSEVHRLLQLAANFYDVNSPTIFPSVFRPTFGADNNGRVFIRSYVYEPNSAFYLNPSTRILNLPADLGVVNANGANSLMGVVALPTGELLDLPVIIGAKNRLLGGRHLFPNFNELTHQMICTSDFASRADPTLNQNILALDARILLETWNSTWSTALSTAALRFDLGVVCDLRGSVADTRPSVTPINSRLVLNTILTNSAEFIVYPFSFPLWARTNTGSAAATRLPISISLTNRISYALAYAGRLVDYTHLVVTNSASNRLLPASNTRDSDEVSWLVDDPLVNAWSKDMSKVENQGRGPFGKTDRVLPFTWTTGGPTTNSAYNPWNGLPQEILFKDYGLTSAFLWNFPPTNSLRNIGQLGQVHRGTPWQSVYFKAIGPPTVTANLAAASRGGFAEDRRMYDARITSGTITIDFDAYSVPDAFKIYYGDNGGGAGDVLLYDSVGYFSGRRTAAVNFSGASSRLTVVVNEGNNVNKGTAWHYAGSISTSMIVGPGLVGAFSFATDSHPTNDWKLIELFTMDSSKAAETSLLSINQTNDVAWAAALAPISIRTPPEDHITPGPQNYVYFVLPYIPPGGDRFLLFRQDNIHNGRNTYNGPGLCQNTVSTNAAGNFFLSHYNPNYPNSVPTPPTIPNTIVVNGTPLNRYDLVANLTAAINARRASLGNNPPFTKVSQILDVSEVTLNFPESKNFPQYPAVSPFRANWSSDFDYERLPSQLLSLLKVEDEPIVVVYAWGQSLKPADKSIITSGVNVGLVTNYVVTGQVGTRTVLRIKNFNPAITNQPPRMVVESFKVLP